MLTMLVSMKCLHVPGAWQCSGCAHFPLASMDTGTLKGSPMCPDYGHPAAQPCGLYPWMAACSSQVAPSLGVLASPSLPELILWGPELGTICSLLPLCSEPKALTGYSSFWFALEKRLGREQPRNPSFS